MKANPGGQAHVKVRLPPESYEKPLIVVLDASKINGSLSNKTYAFAVRLTETVYGSAVKLRVYRTS
jgi:hypothetical protein